MPQVLDGVDGVGVFPNVLAVAWKREPMVDEICSLAFWLGSGMELGGLYAVQPMLPD